MEIKALLGEHFCNEYNIEDKEYPIEWIEPIDLMVPERFDLSAKICFVEAYLSGYGMEWAEQLYRKHIQALSGGHEIGNEKKNSIDAYVSIFQLLIDDIKANGFDEQKSVVPVGGDNIIMDGAHRVSIAICLRKRLPIVRFPGLRSKYGFQFFEERLLDRIYMDHMALEYIKKRDSAYSACVWPRVGNSSKIEMMEDIMHQYAKIVYKKKLSLNYNGLCNLMIQAYKDFEWIGKLEAKFNGVTAQADLCYAPNAPMYYYVLEINSLDTARQMKTRIRDMYKIGNFSMHTTDTQEESLLIGKMLLNDSAVSFLNEGNPFEDISFYKQIDNLSRILTSDEIRKIAITGESVLGIYGLKKVKELIITGDNGIINSLSQNAEGNLIHKDTFIYPQQFLYDPRYYFHYGKVKFLTLFALKKSGSLSLEDIKLVNTLKESSGGQKIGKTILKELKRRYRNYKRTAIEKIYTWLVKINLLRPAKKVYHFIRRK